jgi:hypothetical protein
MARVSRTQYYFCLEVDRLHYLGLCGILTFGHVRGVRQVTMIASLATVLLTARIADEAAIRLRINRQESTTATALKSNLNETTIRL